MNQRLKDLIVGNEAFVPLRRARIAYRARHGGHPDWAHLLGKDRTEWHARRESVSEGPRILVATSVGLQFGATALESLLGIALTLRGAKVSTLFCDGVLPACLSCSLDWFPGRRSLEACGPQADLCKHCFGPAAEMERELGLHLLRYSDGLDETARAEARRIATEIPLADIETYRDKAGIPIGEHSLAGALRYFARGDLAGEAHGEMVLRRYFEAGLLTALSISRLIDRERFEAVVLHHGIYVPQGIICEIARKKGLRVVTWFPSYRKGTFIFSHGTTYHHEMMDEPNEAWDTMPWSDAQDRKIGDYLASRATGAQDWISFHHHAKAERSAIEAAIGIDFSKPTIGLLTNVIWDAKLHYPQNAFPSMMDWIEKTIAWFAGRPHLQLLIRVHPAELTGNVKSRQRVADELAVKFPRLPPNVFVVGPESDISTYNAMGCCDSVLIYGTKTGVELSSMGIPVIVAGEAWIRRKGISLDVESEENYFALLETLPLRERLSPARTERARKYAYHFFFRRMIPLEHVVPRKGFPPFKLDFEGGLGRLRPGASIGLDVICDGILKGSPFIYPDEQTVQSGDKR